MFDSFTDKATKIIDKIKKTKDHFESPKPHYPDGTISRIFIVLDPDDQSIRDQFQHFDWPIDPKPEFIKYEELDKDTRLFDNIEDFAGIYISYDPKLEFDIENIKQNLESQKSWKRSLNNLMHLEVQKLESGLSKDLNIANHNIKLLEYELERTAL